MGCKVQGWCKARGAKHRGGAKQEVQRKGGGGKGAIEKGRKRACAMYVFLFVAANLLPFPFPCTLYLASSLFFAPLGLHPAFALHCLLCTPPELCSPFSAPLHLSFAPPSPFAPSSLHPPLLCTSYFVPPPSFAASALHPLILCTPYFAPLDFRTRNLTAALLSFSCKAEGAK